MNLLASKPCCHVADAVSRWAAVVEREGAKVISAKARKAVTHSLDRWDGGQMPIDGAWIDRDLEGLSGDDEAIARLAVVVGKASYRVTDKLVVDVLGEECDEARFIRILAWASFSAARRFAQIVASKAAQGCEPEARAAA